MSRSSKDEPFGSTKSLFSGRFPTLSANELIIVFTTNDKLQMATRTDRDQPFGNSQPISDLQSSNHVKTPSLSADGLHLVWFTSANGNNPKRFWVSNRGGTNRACFEVWSLSCQDRFTQALIGRRRTAFSRSAASTWTAPLPRAGCESFMFPQKGLPGSVTSWMSNSKSKRCG